MKILNLYSGIGGNRKLWTPNGNEHEITAVEINEEIAAIYKHYFPNDNLIIGDAHEYLINHYKEFDFIWSSPPCPTHSRLALNLANSIYSDKRINPKYPNMKLYQEIIFLDNFYNGLYCIENVIPFYEPLISPTSQMERHLFWTNFKINKYKSDNIKADIINMTGKSTNYGFNISNHKIKHRKDQILRNLVNPDLGLHILNCALGKFEDKKQIQLKLNL